MMPDVLIIATVACPVREEVRTLPFALRRWEGEREPARAPGLGIELDPAKIEDRRELEFDT